jgi:hypothetical protein
MSNVTDGDFNISDIIFSLIVVPYADSMTWKVPNLEYNIR